VEGGEVEADWNRELLDDPGRIFGLKRSGRDIRKLLGAESDRHCELEFRLKGGKK
jgi:hypothetical protein